MNVPKHLLPAVTIAVALSPVAGAQTKRPMVIDDLITSIRISDPQLSPDGRQVLFIRTATTLESGQRNADIWMVPADGSAPPAPFIGGEKNENSPRFLPDGKGVLFISTRDGAPQVYRADKDGKNVKQVTRVSGSVQPPLVISPDGRRAAFVSDVYPSCTDEDCNRKQHEAASKDPVKMRRLTRLPYRHWDEWRESIRHHVLIADIETGKTRDVTPGDFDSPPHFYEDYAIAFAPDGRTIAFVSNREGTDREMWTTNHDVWLVPVEGGDARKILVCGSL